MQSVLGYPAGSCEIDWIEVPAKSGRRTPHPFLLPHKFFAAYHSDCRSSWRDVMAGPIGACRQFWESVEDTLFMERHPDLAPETWACTVPIGIHGDGGAFSKED
eukprot:5390722-Pyramimonas_sp.AAC.1